MNTCLGFHQHRVLRDFCSGMPPQLLAFYQDYFQFQNFRENANETGNFNSGIAMGRRGKFPWEFFYSNVLAFSYIFQAQFNQSRCFGYHWKELFLPQNLSFSNAFFFSQERIFLSQVFIEIQSVLLLCKCSFPNPKFFTKKHIFFQPPSSKRVIKLTVRAAL